MIDDRPARARPDAVPEADALEQSRGWVEDREDDSSPVEVPIDAPEGDVLDQHRPVDLDEEDAPGAG